MRSALLLALALSSSLFAGQAPHSRVRFGERDFRLGASIGAGGFGEVFELVEESRPRRAIKITYDPSRETEYTLRAQAESLRQLAAEKVPVMRIDEVDPLERFMIVERMTGETLSDWLKKAGSLPRQQLEEEWELLRKFAQAIHGSDLQMIDGKLDNFFFDRSARNWKVIDPGFLTRSHPTNLFNKPRVLKAAQELKLHPLFPNKLTLKSWDEWNPRLVRKLEAYSSIRVGEREFVLGRHLGGGANGQVFELILADGAKAAIKFAHSPRASGEHSLAEQSKALSLLSEGKVQSHEVRETHPRGIYQVQDYVPGETLESFLRNWRELSSEELVEKWQKWESYSKRLKNAGLVIDDPKPANFIYDRVAREWVMIDPGHVGPGKMRVELTEHPSIRMQRGLLDAILDACIRTGMARQLPTTQ